MLKLYPLGKAVCAVICKTYFRLVVEDADKVPATGAFVLAANHVSYVDPPAMGVACPRTVHFMAKAELFSLPVLGWVMPRINAFPVHRGAADRSAIRKALELLAQGEVVGVFPEGTRSHTGEMLAPQGGAAMLALKADVPVVPAALWGTNRIDGPAHLPKPVQIGVKFGDPITLAKPEVVDRATIASSSRQIMEAIAAVYRTCPQ